jgi:hypothetical protein
MSFDYKYPPLLGPGVIDNLFRDANRIPTSYRREFYIPPASRPEICALHVNPLNPIGVDEDFCKDNERGYLMLSRPITGDDNTLPEIEVVYRPGDEEKDNPGWKFLLEPLRDKGYQVRINTQFPNSSDKLDPETAAHVGDFAYQLILGLSRKVTNGQTSL